MTAKNGLYPRPPELLQESGTKPFPLKDEISGIRQKMEFLRSEKTISPRVQKILKELGEKLMCLGIPETEVNTIYRP